jgi:hypothetical protein
VIRTLAVLCGALALAAAGCGGDESASKQWADDFCTSVGDWRDEVEAAASDLADPSSLDEQTLDEAVRQAVAATDDLLADLGQLGPPQTDAGDEIEQQLNDLEDILRARASQTRKALEQPASSVSDAFARLATIAEQLADSAKAVEQTIARVRKLDPAGELEQALRESDACEGLR